MPHTAVCTEQCGIVGTGFVAEDHGNVLSVPGDADSLHGIRYKQTAIAIGDGEQLDCTRPAQTEHKRQAGRACGVAFQAKHRRSGLQMI